ncbi:magnesium transporter CorA family protein [Oenococcus sicerae]|uniref:Magnesium transporter CorA family protein n=1 Tax=Oenococcus sicerae TaxID=2203724 RepID=A0AAJ1RCG8_9LACO|nr:magnesium transporter CorA family protein [Oenococcus sicerae]MDN6901093.1 magnesium transporter CorA family protein [Oenococcus sicerae]
MLTEYSIQNDQIKPKTKTSEKTLLIDIVHPDKTDVTFLMDQTGLSREKIDNLLHKDEELRGDQLKGPNNQSFYLIGILFPDVTHDKYLDDLFTNLTIFLFQDAMIIVSERDFAFISETIRQFGSNGKHFDIFELMMEIILSSFIQMSNDLRQLKKKIDKLEDAVRGNEVNKNIFERISILEKNIVLLLSVADANDFIIDYLSTNSASFKLREEKNSHLFVLLKDRVATLERMLHNYDQFLDSLENLINNNISLQLNNIMKTLTNISLVLTIPTIIFGFWGINTKVPFEKKIYGDLFVLGIGFIVSAAFYYWLHKRKYL